jgi:uncharacterized protein
VLRTVSRKNVEIVREVLDAYSRRDVETLRRFHSDDVELDWSASEGWLAGIYRGREEILSFFADYFETWEQIVIEAESYTPVGDRVVVPNIAYQRGRDGIQVTTRATFVYRVCDGRVTRICLYQDQEQALKAVGLQE